MGDITEEKRYEARVEIENNFTKGLLIINGGAVVTCLGLAQAIFESSKSLAIISMKAAMIFAFALFFSVLVNYCRYFVIFYPILLAQNNLHRQTNVSNFFITQTGENSCKTHRF